MFTLNNIIRWIYYSKAGGHPLHRVVFDGKENQVVTNITSRVIDIEIDFVDKRVYWMEYDTGDLKSALYNGSDVKTVIRTNVQRNNREIDIWGDYVFYTSNNKILKLHKSSGQIPVVVHTVTTQIYGVLFYKQEGIFKTIGAYLALQTLFPIEIAERPNRLMKFLKMNRK
ncbi:unnamed protein product [Mytilus coruscus]|uniref:DUF5050 domain-containing protein n=1 Tax=Mytilus coruscus TaxID=42192 RepID=A0A6J8DNA4_MYTCO|nr:unnamed protein product [Mytilus coruscus]